MKMRFALMSSLALLLAACGQSTPTAQTGTPSGTSPTASIHSRSRVYEVMFQGGGQEQPTASAHLINPPLSALALANAPEPLGLSNVSAGSFVYTTGGTSTRHIQTTIAVTNTSGTTLTNLAFVPVITTDTDGDPSNNAQTPTVSGTPFRAVRFFDNSDASSKAATLVPTQGQVLNVSTGLPANDPLASPFLTNLDVSGLTPTPPAGLTATAQNYGWTVATSLAPGATTNVTLAVDLPGIDRTKPKLDPYSFNLLFTGAFDGPSALTLSGDSSVKPAVPYSLSLATTNVNVASFKVDWGDGAGPQTITGPTTTTLTHTYAQAGDYTVSVDMGSGLQQSKAVNVISPCSAADALNVGEVMTLSAAEVSQSCLPGGASGKTFTVVPFNPSTTTPIDLILTSTNTTTALGAASLQGGAAAVESPLTLDQTASALPGTAAQSISRLHAAALRPQSIPQNTVPALGDTVTLNVATGCTGALDNRTFTVRSISNHAIVLSDDNNPAGGYTTSDYGRLGDNFDIAYDVVVNNFAAPTDQDGNGHVVLAFTRAVNELTPPATGGEVPSYFTNRDTASTASCARSNQGEVLYMGVPDPTGAVNSNVRTSSSVAGTATRQMVRELTKLTNAFNRAYVTGASSFEEPWLDESLANVAEELMFYRATQGGLSVYTSPGGFGTPTTTAGCTLTPGLNIQLNTLTTGSAASCRVAQFNTFANFNFTRLRSSYQYPQTSTLTGLVPNSAGKAQQYSMNWAFLRYAADRYTALNGGTDSDFWKRFISTSAGLTNLQAVLGVDPALWLKDYVLAAYMDDAPFATSSLSKYKNPSWNFRSVFGGLGGYPLKVNSPASGTPQSVSLTAGMGAAAYYRYAVAAGQQGSLQITDANGAAPSNLLSVMVIRIQ